MNMLEILKKEITKEEHVALSRRDQEIKTTNLLARRNEANLSDQKKRKFLNAIKKLIGNGLYNETVNVHANANYDMHGWNMANSTISRTGIQRFLPWHRAYLLEFEKKLIEIDSSLTIPYWKWTENQRFPEWLEEFRPQGLINRKGERYDVVREIGISASLPEVEDIKRRMTNQTYTDFTLALEGLNPYGAHNQVHVYVGGTMGTMYSPADPVFWLHHSECDRLWHIWQTTHAEENASLIGQSAVMSPWQFRYKDLVDITQLGYIYEENEV